MKELKTRLESNQVTEKSELVGSSGRIEMHPDQDRQLQRVKQGELSIEDGALMRKIRYDKPFRCIASTHKAMRLQGLRVRAKVGKPASFYLFCCIIIYFLLFQL